MFWNVFLLLIFPSCVSFLSVISKVNADETARRVAQFKATAKAKGVKLTPQRLEVFREIASSLQHPDAEAVHRAVHARMPTVSLDTVYRTLWMLSELGLISVLGARRESVRFDANPTKHHHYVCIRCGLTRDFESDELQALRLPAAVKRIGNVLSTHIEARGICEICTKKSSKKKSNPISPKGRKDHVHE
jgi:Fur family transcriptional regulator, peroxide stress response regulator